MVHPAAKIAPTVFAGPPLIWHDFWLNLLIILLDMFISFDDQYYILWLGYTLMWKNDFYDNWSTFPIIQIVLIIGGWLTGKANVLQNLISKGSVTEKMYLYAKDLFEPKYKYLFTQRESAGQIHFNDPNSFVE